MIRLISKKTIISRILIIALVLSMFLSMTSVAMDIVPSYESANTEKTAKEAEKRGVGLDEDNKALMNEDESKDAEDPANADEEDGDISEKEKPSEKEETELDETEIDENIIVDDENIEEEVPQLDSDGEPLAVSSSMLSNYGNRVPINDANDLVAFLNGTLGNNDDEFILMNDINMSGRGSFRGRGGNVAFTGRFASEEGSRYTISNLSLTGRNALDTSFGTSDVGFIRTAGNQAIIENVNFDRLSYVEPPTNNGSWAGLDSHIGLVVGRVTGGAVNIKNINVTNSTMTIGSSANASISQANARVGGLIGSIEGNSNVTIAEVLIGAGIQMFRGNAVSNRGGGMVGESAGNLAISDSTVNVDITVNGTAGEFMHAGGVLGIRTAGDVLIKDVVQNGNVQADTWAGGIVGGSSGLGSLTLNGVSTSANKTIHMDPALASATGLNNVGGLVGRAVNNTTISNCKNYSLVSANSAIGYGIDAGGLVGFSGGGITISDSVNYGNLNLTGAVNHSRMAGILARTENNVTMRDVVNWGNITRVEHTDTYSGDVYPNPNYADNRLSGGILGSADVKSGEVVSVVNAVNHGNMPNRIRLLAGIVGRFIGEGSANVTNSTNYGNLETYERAGGIVGRNELRNLTIEGCINHGRISGERSYGPYCILGGILSSSQTGVNGGANNTVRNVTILSCGNRGDIVSNSSGSSYTGVGGIAGWIPNDGLVIKNSYNIGRVSSTANSGGLGGIVGAMQWSSVSIELKNVYSLGPVISPGASSGNAILGLHNNSYINNSNGRLKLENVYVSAFFSGNAITNSDRTNLVESKNVYLDRTTAPTTVASRLQTELSQFTVTAVTTEQLVSGDLVGLQGEPWRYGIAGEPNLRTMPYFAWQTGEKQQEPFFKEVYATNAENVTGGKKLWLSGITSFPLVNNVTIDVLYSTEGFDNNVRVFTPNNGGASYTKLSNEAEVRHIIGNSTNIPSRLLTTGLISANDVVGFDVKAGYRIYFDLNEGEQTDETPLAQIIDPAGGLAIVPEVEREGYLFTGWNTALNGTGTLYSPGEDIMIESNGTFYAQWVPDITDLTIAKKVKGEYGNFKKEFTFTIYFERANGSPFAGGTKFNYEGDTVGDYNNPAPSDGELTLDSNGSATFKLKAGQAIRITDAPAYGSVQVVEKEDNLYTVSIIDSEDEDATTNGTDTNLLPAAKNRTFTYLNERIYVPQTGVDFGNMGAVLLGVISLSALALFVLHVVFKHRRSTNPGKA